MYQCAREMQSTIMVYRLRDAGKISLHIAEVTGLGDEILATAATTLYKYERKRGFLTDDIVRGVYTFIRHDKRSTKAMELVSTIQENRVLGLQETNAMTREALAHSVQGVFTLVMGVGEKVDVSYLEAAGDSAQFDVGHLARFLA